MAFTRCPICQEWDVGNHRCKPTFLVWCEEQGECEDDARTIYAHDAESAAQKWADQEDHESAEYSIVAQKWEPTVTVQDQRDNELKWFIVSGEAVPSYSATEVAT